MQHPFDFMGKWCKIDLSVLHDFGGCAKRVYASILLTRPDEPDIDQPPHIVPDKKSIWFGIPGHISQYCRPYILFLTCKGI